MYAKAILEIVEFDVEDVITTSLAGDELNPDEEEGTPIIINGDK